MRLPNQSGEIRSPATLNRIKSAFRSFFVWAFRTGRSRYDHSAYIHLGKAHSRRTTPMTDAEVWRYLQAIRESSDRNRDRDEALFATYAFTGMRRSEVLSLKIMDYEPIAGNLFIARAKGGMSRIQPVPVLLSRILDQWIFMRETSQINDRNSHLFPGQSGTRPMSARHAQVLFDKWKRIASIRKELTIHSFRAFFATSLYEVSGDMLAVARALGHRDTRTTERYIAADCRALREIIESTFS